MILKNSDISSLDEIKRAIPMYWREFDDYMALQRFVAEEMDTINGAAMQVIDNAFILKCDDETLLEIEKFLNIYDIADRVTKRSIYVNSVLTSIGKLSVSKLKSWIKTILGSEPNIYFVNDSGGNRLLTIDFVDRPAPIPGTIALIAGRLPAGMCVAYINQATVEGAGNMTGTVVIEREGVVVYPEPLFETGFEL